jgi:hypothetical protein
MQPGITLSPPTRTERSVRAQRGASIIEMLILVPVFGMLLGGIFELSMLYRARAILDAATFEAAQQGSLNNAQIGPMRVGLAQGMAPHLVRNRNVGGVIAANADATLRVRTTSGSVRIISPTRDVFQRFAERQTIQTTLDNRERAQNVIPNDNLMWRPATVRQARVGGQNVPMTVQDANLLKIETAWCERLKVPILDRVIARTLYGFIEIPSQCLAVALADQARFGRSGRYVLLRSHAVARMQSPVVLAGLPN